MDSLPLAQQGVWPQGNAKVSYGQEFNMKHQGLVPTLPQLPELVWDISSQLGLILPRRYLFIYFEIRAFLLASSE